MRRPLAGLLALLTACQAAATEPVIRPAPAALQSAPAAVTLAGQTVTIEPFLWRDFQPVAPSDGHPLIAAVRVRAAAGAPLAADVAADSVWVLWDGRAWAARAVQEQPRSATNPVLEVVARNGPKWGPGVRVDVVVRLRDGAGAVAYVRAAGQPITRTD